MMLHFDEKALRRKGNSIIFLLVIREQVEDAILQRRCFFCRALYMLLLLMIIGIIMVIILFLLSILGFLWCFVNYVSSTLGCFQIKFKIFFVELSIIPLN